jgi:hypothetical protein
MTCSGQYRSRICEQLRDMALLQIANKAGALEGLALVYRLRWLYKQAKSLFRKLQNL